VIEGREPEKAQVETTEPFTTSSFHQERERTTNRMRDGHNKRHLVRYTEFKG
jgi:hypothetical protein